MEWYEILAIVIGSIIGSYILFLLILVLEFPQRHAKIPYWRNRWRPETLGFSSERVHPFYLKTADNERIFAWHILPFDCSGNHSKTNHLQILQEDKSARVIIYCTPTVRNGELIGVHGTASHVAQTLRLDTYRLLTSSNKNTHLLAIDYRGWGYSSGTPSEKGVITDGLATLDWALNTAHVHPSRILLVSQSLGTAIAMGVIAEYTETHPEQPLAGIVMIAGFTSLRKLVGGYRMAGFLPLLAPLAIFPRLLDFFLRKCLCAEFNTEDRLRRLRALTRDKEFTITFVHAVNDWEISYVQSRQLFEIAVGEEGVVAGEMSDCSWKTNELGSVRLVEGIWGGA